MKIIIPMTGKSMRFKNAGISIPKQFLTVNKKMIIEHVLDLFPNESDINFIVNEEEFKNKSLQKYFGVLENFNIFPIPYKKEGPGKALLSTNILDTEEKVFINYCDFSNIWNWEELKNYIKRNNPDGLVPAYSGLHPHSIYGNDYAFLKVDGERIIDIKEKESFTDKKIDEFASSGSYYFKSGHIAKKYINRIFDKKMLINGEAYISTPYEEMIKDGLKIYYFKIDYFFQWGTPEDYNEFLYSLDEVNNVSDKKKIDLNGINLLIPAGGEGKRFKEENYKTEKIFLDVDGKPLISNIISSFKNQESTSILITKNNQDSLKTLNLINSEEIMTISEKTNDQAHSGMKLVEKIDNDLPILIHSADCILEKDIELNIPDYDVGVITKKNYRRAFFKFENYGWVNSDNGNITSFSIKEKPHSKNSNVITGIFLFKNKNIYKQLFQDTLERLNNLNSEIHIDYLIQTAMIQNMKVKEINTNKTVMIGTPVEYELYKYMYDVNNYLNQT